MANVVGGRPRLAQRGEEREPARSGSRKPCFLVVKVCAALRASSAAFDGSRTVGMEALIGVGTA